ncbi:GNAT family N-acetyltransferase [Bacillus sp. 2205SS5-2]|uniref:GNAT family N-acetyltransferase n=1 Tax=Bacillus sp. 2205SS5-2 TaxID=3109031 RepID=UPI003005AF0C
MQTNHVLKLNKVEEMLPFLPLLQELRPAINENRFYTMTKELIDQGYCMMVLLANQEPVALAGVVILTNYYDGKHVYVYDLVTSLYYRSKGYGEELLCSVESWGKQRGCENIVLSTGIQRRDAHRFYQEKGKYMKASYVFRKPL